MYTSKIINNLDIKIMTTKNFICIVFLIFNMQITTNGQCLSKFPVFYGLGSSNIIIHKIAYDSSADVIYAQFGDNGSRTIIKYDAQGVIKWATTDNNLATDSYATNMLISTDSNYLYTGSS